MFVAFFFRRYPNSRLATFVSVFAGISLCFSVAFITALLFSWYGRDTDEKRTFLLIGIICAVLYFVLRFLAKWINERKSAKRKANEKNAANGGSNMYENAQTEPLKNKKFRFWWIIVIIFAISFVAIAVINNRSASKTNDRETTVAEEQDDGSLPASLRGSVGEMKTFDCYYIESAYVYDPENPGRVLFAKGQYSGMDYLCKVYISRERYDTDCVYLHIAVDDFEEVFGENAASTAGASGTIVFNNIDKDTVVFARLYDEPIQITGKIMDSEELGPFNSWFKDISDKTRLMDFISVSY